MTEGRGRKSLRDTPVRTSKSALGAANHVAIAKLAADAPDRPLRERVLVPHDSIMDGAVGSPAGQVLTFGTWRPLRNE